MSGNVKSLSDHKAVTELLSLMRKNGRKLEAMALSSMISSIDNIDKQYSEFLSTTQDQKKQLIEIAEQCRVVGADPPDLNLTSYQVFQIEAEQVLVKVAAVQDKIVAWAKDTIKNFELTGTSALDTAKDIVDIYSLLETLRKQARSSAWNMLACTETIGGQTISFIRAARDEELSPLRVVRKLLSNVNNAVFSAIGGMKHSEQTAKDVREARAERQAEKRSSIRQTLVEKKAESAAHSAPTPEKEHKSKEAAR